jgi:hypothetical protein
MDFDPRDYDSRPDDRLEIWRGRGGRGVSNDRDHDDDWSPPEIAVRDRDDHARDLGRGPGSTNRDEASGSSTFTCCGPCGRVLVPPTVISELNQ